MCSGAHGPNETTSALIRAPAAAFAGLPGRLHRHAPSPFPIHVLTPLARRSCASSDSKSQGDCGERRAQLKHPHLFLHKWDTLTGAFKGYLLPNRQYKNPIFGAWPVEPNSAMSSKRFRQSGRLPTGAASEPRQHSSACPFGAGLFHAPTDGAFQYAPPQSLDPQRVDDVHRIGLLRCNQGAPRGPLWVIRVACQSPNGSCPREADLGSSASTIH
jgi:hypothetical protein